MRTERDPISLAERINSLSLDSDEISGGAIIQKNHSFALMAARHVANQIAIHMPDVIIAAINSNNQAKQIKDKIIYSLEDLLPKQFRDIRTGEFAIHATRLTLLRVLHAFGHNRPLEINVNFSAVGGKEKYKEALGVFSRDFEQSIFSFFSDLFEAKRIPLNPCDYVTIRFEVESRNVQSHVFGPGSSHLIGPPKQDINLVSFLCQNLSVKFDLSCDNFHLQKYKYLPFQTFDL